MQLSRSALLVLLLLMFVLQFGAFSTVWGDGVQSGITITRIKTTKVAFGPGSVSPSCPGGCSETVGSLITVTATPSATWQFSKWTTLGVSCVGGLTSNPCAFTMPNNAVTVSASFAHLTTLITRVDSGAGSVSPSCPGPSGCSELAGSPVKVTAMANSGSEFSSWSTQSGISCSSNPCSFTMPNNAVTLGATFKRITSTSLSCPSAQPSGFPGTCTATISGGISPTGTVTFTQSGYSFGVTFSGSGCTISGSGSSQQAVCTVSAGSASVTVQGTYATGSVTITGTYSGDSANAGSSGTATIIEEGT